MRRFAGSMIVVLSACSPAVDVDRDAGASKDSGTPAADASVADAGETPDAGTVSDAGEPDAGTVIDAGVWVDAGIDAGPVDAGQPLDAGGPFSTNRALFFGAPRCTGAGFRLCDSFESGVIDSTTWTVSGGTAVAIGTAEHARGTRALHITKVGNGAAYIRETRTFPAPNNTYYGRAFMKFVSMPAAPMTYSHWTVIAASGTGVDGEIRIGGQLQANKLLFGVGTDNRTQAAGTGDWTTSDADPAGSVRAVPLGEWICLEWLHQGSSNETRFWWDATEHASLHTTPTHHGGNTNPFLLPQFTNFWIGWQEYQAATQTFELWVDEIAIDSNRIGCVR